MRRSAMAVLIVVVLFALLTQALADEGNRLNLRPADPADQRVLPRKTYPDGCDESARLALREAGMGVVPPSGYVPVGHDLSGRQCELECNPCAHFESEPECSTDYVDTWNGGCNSTPNVFELLAPAYGRLEVCGKSGTYLFGGSTYRDTDWYEITVTQQTQIIWTCIAEFPMLLGYIDASLGCGAPVFEDYVIVEECVENVMELNLAPGSYWLFVAPSDWGGYPCDSIYMMSLEGYMSAPDCVEFCPPGAIIEGEPVCGPDYVDEYNSGCNHFTEQFLPIDPVDGQIVICGQGGVYPWGGLCYRDTDWYELELDEPREIEFCIMSGFDYQLLIIDGNSGCPVYGFMYQLTGPPCDVVCDTYALDPGIYWLWVGSWSWVPVDCGRRYVVTVTGYTTPVDDTSWGSLKALYR